MTTMTTGSLEQKQQRATSRQGKGELLFSQGAVSVIEETLRDITTDGRLVQREIATGTYTVAGSRGKTYEVVKSGRREYSCTCPDAEFSGQTICKHAYAVEAHVQASDRRDLLTHELARFQEMLDNPKPGGLSAKFIERRVAAARTELEKLEDTAC